ncbi:hypothetical protein F53441_10185 [Fusarium austroafricanum]|uniref:ATP-citrate synthase/succinyl-CoA ligase C-terminal domain-containing protein n=1 Tax=Fusarium austroafricanum TaxID=2364996 RepID=A0A8H4KAB6_9HYPO|nr:hypothetical protein F53441_10185 [Fusarium austroafricanum]
MTLRLGPGSQHAPSLINALNIQIRYLHLHEWQFDEKLTDIQAKILVPRAGRLVKTEKAARGMMKDFDIKPQDLTGRPQVPKLADLELARQPVQDVLGYFKKQNEKRTPKSARIPLYVEGFTPYDTKWRLTMAVDREKYRPVIKIRNCEDSVGLPDPRHELAFQKDFWFDLSKGISNELFNDISQSFQLPIPQQKSLKAILSRLFGIFSEKEALSLELDLLGHPKGMMFCSNLEFVFDDAARDRQHDLFALRAKDHEGKDEPEAEKHGLVYIRLDGDIGNVVNGAGLAMATMDTVALYGGSSSNFLDAGGQATKETMLQAFKIILADERVKAILVNIYGGITNCSMIAESIIAAASELGPLRVPVVARLQGTNSEAGLKLLEDANLGIHIEADFGEAARKVVELAKQQTQEPVEKSSAESSNESLEKHSGKL